MKIKKGSLLTILLALICALAVALGVDFLLPKHNSKTANAAASESITLNINDAGGRNIIGNFEQFLGGTAMTFNEVGRGYGPDNQSAEFSIMVPIPARTECEVEFTFPKIYISGAGADTVTLSAVPYDNDSAASEVISGSPTGPTAYTENIVIKLKLTNKLKEKPENGTEAKFKFTANLAYAPGAAHQVTAGLQFNSAATMTKKKVLSPVTADYGKTEAEDIYTGSTIDFSMYYNTDYVQPKTIGGVAGKDLDGNELETAITMSDIDTTTDTTKGIFKPTLAGKYTVTFELTSLASADGVTWAGGVSNPTLTFTVKRKAITVPDIVTSEKSQIFDAEGRTFTPNSNYTHKITMPDSSIKLLMSAASVSSGITWDSNINKFKATKVGEHTVKFKLEDKKNYIWDDGSENGSLDDQEKKVKITKKQLTIPKIETEPQTYNGTALTYKLNTDFDSTIMKMDGVTPDITGNVVTGPGNLGLMPTSNTFLATNVGTYTVKISLRDTDNYEWKDETTTQKEAVFKVERKELVTGIACSHTVLGLPQWGQGTNGVKMTVTLGKVANQYPALSFYYDNNPANALEVASSTDTEIVVNLPNTISIGQHTFNIALDDENAGYNKNYKVEAPNNSLAFTVTNTESAVAYYNGNEISATIKEEYDGNGKIAKGDISIKGVMNGTSVTDFTVTYYKGTTPTAGNELATGELPTDVGDYCVKITLGTQAADIYTLANDEFVVTITPKSIVAPTLGSANLVFNGLTQNIKDLLTYDKDIIELVTANSVLEGYHADTYSVYFKIKDEYKDNYVFVLPEVKATAKKSVADEQTSYSVTLSDNDKSAQLDWNIQKYVYDTTTSSAWNFTKEGATLSFKGVPASIVALTTGPNPTLIFDVNYYDQSYNALSEVTLSGGNKYYVAASLADCADRDDIVFKNQTFDNGIGRDISPHASYTVPKNSGLSTFFNKVKEFMSGTAVGMPVWSWFLIALALLILLIIIIVVACKRRKSKEEKEAIKAAKEEEKARKEEERQRQEEEHRRKEEERAEEKRRRDEEREEEKRRREEERAEEKRRREEQLEHEREMARAKQEAELEKIKAQQAANAGMAGMGMASMAMAQQPVQQPVQPQPVQQVVDNSSNELLKEMRAQMAELRADNKATQAQLQAMQNQQNQQQQAQPMQMPMYQQQPMYPQYPMYQQMPMQMPYGGNDIALARMEAQLNAMQAEQRARYDAEQRIELAAMRAESHVDRDSRHSVDLAAMREHINGYNYNRLPDYSAPQLPYNNQQSNMDMMGALVAATLKNMANGEAAATQVPELPQNSGQSTPTAKYPSDAVITTTTTVDTTKNKPIRREENFDIDGFYDPLD